MIGKGKSIKHCASLIQYVSSREQAVEIDRNLLVGETPSEIAQEFRIFQSLNSRCSSNTFSFVLSPSVDDAPNLNNDDFLKLTQDFIGELKLNDHQYIAYLHQEKAHKHLHIICNRINSKGIAYKDNFIGKKVQDIGEKLSHKYNLTASRDVQKINEQKLRDEIKKVHKEILSQKPKDLNEYSNLMKQKGINTLYKKDKNGKVVGVKFEVNGKTINASKVDRMLSALNLQKTIYNIAKRIIKQTIKSSISGI